jgi:hypothetical protein
LKKKTIQPRKIDMKPIALASAILMTSFGAYANEALDVLEGKKKASDIALPTAQDTVVKEGGITYPDATWPEWQARTFDPVWARAVLFHDDKNPWVQHLAMTGFFEWQYADGQAEVRQEGGPVLNTVDVDSSETRRARLGARMRAFRNTNIEAVGEIAGNANHSGIERLSARTELPKNFGVTYGKFRPQFTAEYRQEPEQSPYHDRAMLLNMIAPATTLGVRFDYQYQDWEYGIGWFSSDSDPYLPSVEADGILAINIARNFVETTGDTVTRTRWHLDYLHNYDVGESGSAPRYNVAGHRSANGNQLVVNNPAFRHLFSTGFTLEQDRFSFLGDFMLAKGDTTAWGLTLAPAVWAVPGYLRIVGRYHYAGSDDPGAIVSTMGASSDPYFDSSPFFIGDEYHSFYLGANAHLYKDRLLLMTGFEKVMLDDEAGQGFNTDATIWHTGVKASF